MPRMSNTVRTLSCGLGRLGGTDKPIEIVFYGTMDMSQFTTLAKHTGIRSQARMMESLKYIQTLMTPPEQRKPY
jgi:hypothetical protein